MCEDPRLRNLEATGYPYGGMSTAQEKAMEEYQENDDKLIAITSEIGDVEEFISSAQFLGDHMAALLRQHYEDQKDRFAFNASVAKLRMMGGPV